MDEYVYTYRQGGPAYVRKEPLRIKTNETPSCMAVVIRLFVLAFGYFLVGAMVYIAWEIFVTPIWQNLLKALGG